MTFWSAEKSVQDSRPVELVDFACGATHWRQTSGPLTVTYATHDYTPQPGLAVGDLEDTGNYLRSGFEIEMEWGNPFLLLYPGTPPDSIVTVTVYRRQGTDVSLWCAGYVAATRRKADRKASVACVSSYSALGRGTLCLRCGRLCQVPLYSELCGLDIADWEWFIGTVDTVSGCDVTCPQFALYADDWFTGGPISINGYSRMVLSHIGDRVTLSEAIPGIAATQGITIAPGCDHKMTTCDTKFSHLLDYKGYPNIPTAKNPFVQGVY